MPSTPPYPEQFRRDAVALVRSSQKSIPQLARELVSRRSRCGTGRLSLADDVALAVDDLALRPPGRLRALRRAVSEPTLGAGGPRRLVRHGTDGRVRDLNTPFG
jgi:hypothetical protein